MRRRAPRAPIPVYKPNDCIIFAVDPGTVSGWCCMDSGLRRADGGWGEVVFSSKGTRGKWGAAIEAAKAIADERKKPLVAVLEIATAGPRDRDERMSPRTLLGMGVNRGRWEAELSVRGIDPIKVNVATWRSGLFGRSAGRRREQFKSMAMLRARMLGAQTSDHNEAEAVCVAAWGVNSGEVAMALARATGCV
jgi:hypothetical protein